MFLKKNRYKPLYKQFIKLKENIQDRKKVFKFKKQKWQFFIQNYKKKFKRYNKYKPQSQTVYTVSKFSNKKSSYKKKYLNNFHVLRLFKLFYGGLKQKSLKKNLNLLTKNTKNYNKFLKLRFLILEMFEKRLDSVLYRAKFSVSMRNSRQLISHGKIFVNNKKTTSNSFKLKSGDLVTVDLKQHNEIKKNIKNLNFWPIPPKHIVINYKTFQIVFNNFKNSANTNINFNLNLEKIIRIFFSSSVVEQVAVNYLDVGSNPT